MFENIFTEFGSDALLALDEADKKGIWFIRMPSACSFLNS